MTLFRTAYVAKYFLKELSFYYISFYYRSIIFQFSLVEDWGKKL